MEPEIPDTNGEEWEAVFACIRPHVSQRTLDILRASFYSTRWQNIAKERRHSGGIYCTNLDLEAAPNPGIDWLSAVKNAAMWREKARMT
jgi:hypothetical protein